MSWVVALAGVPTAIQLLEQNKGIIQIQASPGDSTDNTAEVRNAPANWNQMFMCPWRQHINHGKLRWQQLKQDGALNWNKVLESNRLLFVKLHFQGFQSHHLASYPVMNSSVTSQWLLLFGQVSRSTQIALPLQKISQHTQTHTYTPANV